MAKDKKGKGKGGKDRPDLPTRKELYEKFSERKPWENNEEWYGDQLDKLEDFRRKALKGGINDFERRRLKRLTRRARAGEDAYRDYMNSQPHGGPGGEGPGGPGEQPAFNQGAFDSMMLLLEQFGLGSLASVLEGLIRDGVTDQASLTLALQNTEEWKRRFAGNEMLRQAGLGVLSPAEYLAVERSYAQVMKNYGLPPGFYDDPSDFAKWIGNSVSASELQSRVQIYADLAKRTDPAIRDQLVSMGMGEGDILAYAMDPTRAMPLIQKKYQTTLIGAAARRQGLVGENSYLEHLADLGITEEQAQQGYGIIADGLGTMETLGDIYGEEFGQRDFEKEVFEQDGTSAKKRKRLASRERANFSGSSGVGQGSLTRDTSGSY